MAKNLTFINFALVLLLGVICVVQWSREKDYAIRFHAQQLASDKQADRLHEQTEELRRVNEDLEGFKQSVTSLKAQTDEQVAAIREQKAKVFTLEGEREQLSKQLANWQRALEEHKTALAARDESIRTLLNQRDQILSANKDAAGKANHAILAYNELATKYEDVVKRYNTLATQFKAEREAATGVAK